MGMIEVGEWIDWSYVLIPCLFTEQHKALVRNWVETTPRCFWSRCCPQGANSPGKPGWRIALMNKWIKDKKGKGPPRPTSYFSMTKTSHGVESRISPPDTEGTKRPCWNSVNYMSHASWFQLPSFIFSAWQDNLALYNHCHKKSRVECRGEREERTAMFLNYPYITALSLSQRKTVYNY